MLIDDEPYRIKDLRWRQGDGRIIHLDGRPPYPLTVADTIQRFDLVTPPR
ncbi:hypothetical protein ACIRPK_26760 [Kitasatospora sp. NPDC101801]